MIDPLRWAKFYAATKHGNQQYHVGLPYTHHLAAVEAVLRRFGFVELDYLETAWLHDVVEDTGVKVKEIAELFGDRVASLVSAVTNEPGANRKIRHALTYPKIRSTQGATIIKLADRIANVEQGGNLVDMYTKEYEDFKRSLYEPRCDDTRVHSMWARLDELLVQK